MLTKIKKVISDAFLGDAIAETEDIHHSANGELRIRLGLFRKKDTETVWLDFIKKTFMGRSSVGLGITVDSFQSFSGFLGEAVRKGENKEGTPYRIPFLTRMILIMSEGVSQPILLGEYRAVEDPKSVTRIFSFINRRQQQRYAFDSISSGYQICEVFDLEFFSMLEREIVTRQNRAPNRVDSHSQQG